MKNLKIGPKLILCFMLVTCLSSISGILGAFFFALVRSELQQSSCGKWV